MTYTQCACGRNVLPRLKAGATAPVVHVRCKKFPNRQQNDLPGKIQVYCHSEPKCKACRGTREDDVGNRCQVCGWGSNQTG